MPNTKLSDLCRTCAHTRYSHKGAEPVTRAQIEQCRPEAAEDLPDGRCWALHCACACFDELTVKNTTNTPQVFTKAFTGFRTISDEEHESLRQQRAIRLIRSLSVDQLEKRIRNYENAFMRLPHCVSRSDEERYRACRERLDELSHGRCNRCGHELP